MELCGSPPLRFKHQLMIDRLLYWEDPRLTPEEYADCCTTPFDVIVPVEVPKVEKPLKALGETPKTKQQYKSGAKSKAHLWQAELAAMYSDFGEKNSAMFLLGDPDTPHELETFFSQLDDAQRENTQVYSCEAKKPIYLNSKKFPGVTYLKKSLYLGLQEVEFPLSLCVADFTGCFNSKAGTSTKPCTHSVSVISNFMANCATQSLLVLNHTRTLRRGPRDPYTDIVNWFDETFPNAPFLWSKDQPAFSKTQQCSPTFLSFVTALRNNTHGWSIELVDAFIYEQNPQSRMNYCAIAIDKTKEYNAEDSLKSLCDVFKNKNYFEPNNLREEN